MKHFGESVRFFRRREEQEVGFFREGIGLLTFGITLIVGIPLVATVMSAPVEDTPLVSVDETSSNVLQAAYLIDSYFIANPAGERQNFRIGDSRIETSKINGLSKLESDLEKLANKESLPALTITFDEDYRSFKMIQPNEDDPDNPKVLYDSIEEDLKKK